MLFSVSLIQSVRSPVTYFMNCCLLDVVSSHSVDPHKDLGRDQQFIRHLNHNHYMLKHTEITFLPTVVDICKIKNPYHVNSLGCRDSDCCTVMFKSFNFYVL